MIVSVTNWIISLTLWIFTYKMSYCTTSRDLPSNVWWLHKWQTELSPLPCDFLHIKFLLVLLLETCQPMSADCIIDKLNYLPYLVNLSSNVWWLYQWQTELSPLHCDFLHIKCLLILHLDTCQAMSDDFISDKLNYLPYIVTFLHIKFLLVLHLETFQECLYQWQTELSPLLCDFLHIKFLLILHLETSQAMSDDCISDKLNYIPYIVTFYI